MANEVVQLNPLPTVPQQTTVRTSSILANPEQAKINMRAAELFAESDLVPSHYRNKPANCFIAINRAQRLGVDELYFFEKTYIVKGKLGIAAELAIELANSCGRFRGPIKFRLFGEGDARGCTAFATLASDGEVVENTVTYAMAVAEEWSKNSKWQTMRDQMLQYRAGAFLVRLYAGGALGGMYMREELEDVAAQSNKQPGSVRAEQRTAIASPANEDDHAGPTAEEIKKFEADVKEKLDEVKTTDGLDDLWQSGIGARVREIGAVDKKAQQRIITAFSQKKNAILKAIEADAEAGETPEATDEAPQDAPLSAEQEATLRQVKTDLGVDPDTGKELPRDNVQRTMDAMQRDEDPAQDKPYAKPPKPAKIEVPDGDDGKPAWNRWAKEALEQLKQAGNGEYGTEWAGKWLALNAANIASLRAFNADWAGRVDKLYTAVTDHFRDQEEPAAAEALEHFPTVAVEYNGDLPDWIAFENTLYRYIRDTPNHRVAQAWWKRHQPIIANMAKAGTINSAGRTGAQAAADLKADLIKFFPQLAD
jgi:hypothetical protein